MSESEPVRAGGPWWRDTLIVLGAALGVRLVAVALAATRFPPADDGAFYHVVAERIARGLGYTWLWPDGAVTHAAHYPVGYPALAGALYALFGPHPGVAMTMNAVVGALGAAAVYRLAVRSFSRRAALLSGGLAAFAPELLFYTPALMTEAVCGSLLVIAGAVATLTRPRGMLARAVLAGLVLGVATLVRPQSIVLAPLVGALAAPPASRARLRIAPAVVALGVALLACLPWTLRNCSKLEACTFVSANGGWNLFIGSSPLGEGGWAPLERIGVPEECREVFGEVEKDRCFGRAGARMIAADPGAWLALVPKKLAATFEYGTAAAYYLSVSNPETGGGRVKVLVGGIELLGQRFLLAFSLAVLLSMPGPRPRARRLLGGVFLVLALSPGPAVHAALPPAWPSYLGLVVLPLCLGQRLFQVPALLLLAGTVAMTVIVHSVFFGASRYALVCTPALAAVAGGVLDEFRRRFGTRAEAARAAFDSGQKGA